VNSLSVLSTFWDRVSSWANEQTVKEPERLILERAGQGEQRGQRALLAATAPQSVPSTMWF
jgi:hypothetical protein